MVIKRFLLSFLQYVVRFAKYVQLAVSEFLDDNGSHLSASISYYLLFSIFPLLLAVISIVGFVAGSSQEATLRVEQWITDFLPAAAGDLITDNVGSAISIRGLTGTFALLGLLWGGTSIFNVIRKTLNIIWGITIPRPFLHERLIEIIMMAGVGSLFISSLWLSTVLQFIGKLAPEAPWTAAFRGLLMGRVLPGFIMFLVFLFLYRFTPYVRLRWRDVWIEALLAAVAFEVVKWVFVEFLAVMVRGTIVFSSTIAIIIFFLLFVYVSSVVFLFCAEMASLRFRGVKFWGRDPVVAAEGPLPKNATKGGRNRIVSLLLTAVARLKKASQREQPLTNKDNGGYDSNDDTTR